MLATQPSYKLLPFDRNLLRSLLADFRAVVTRYKDKSLADHLEKELIHSDFPWITNRTLRQLAKWCNTDGHPYQSGMDVARKISNLLFGTIVDRAVLGV